MIEHTASTQDMVEALSITSPQMPSFPVDPMRQSAASFVFAIAEKLERIALIDPRFVSVQVFKPTFVYDFSPGPENQIVRVTYRAIISSPKQSLFIQTAGNNIHILLCKISVGPDGQVMGRGRLRMLTVLKPQKVRGEIVWLCLNKVVNDQVVFARFCRHLLESSLDETLAQSRNVTQELKRDASRMAANSTTSPVPYRQTSSLAAQSLPAINAVPKSQKLTVQLPAVQGNQALAGNSQLACGVIRALPAETAVPAPAEASDRSGSPESMPAPAKTPLKGPISESAAAPIIRPVPVPIPAPMARPCVCCLLKTINTRLELSLAHYVREAKDAFGIRQFDQVSKLCSLAASVQAVQTTTRALMEHIDSETSFYYSVPRLCPVTNLLEDPTVPGLTSVLEQQIHGLIDECVRVGTKALNSRNFGAAQKAQDQAARLAALGDKTLAALRACGN